ncbi:MAG: hypothetical protein R3B90_16470 [Planctomycetaceae bacterium]
MDLPNGGQRLTFTKNGGDPKLTLAVRPAESLRRGLGLLTGAATLLIALVLWRLLTRSRDMGQGIRGAVVALGVVGLLWAVLVPGDLRWVGVVGFIVGAAWWLVLRSSPRKCEV